MRLLFLMDSNDYNKNGSKFIRPSSRAIIIENKKIYMVHSLVNDYYKFPGGGINPGEDKITAVIRETKEEAGLIIDEDSIIEYGYVRKIQNGVDTDIFIQDNYYYLCKVKEERTIQSLDEYEEKEEYNLELVEPRCVIDVNRNHSHGKTNQLMLEREARVIELLIDDGYFK